MADAYVAPAVNGYIESLSRSLVELGAPDNLQVMQSNGGLLSQELVCRYPVRIIESGPAAGVLMCASVGRAEGISRLLTFDTGGTTAKLGAIDDITRVDVEDALGVEHDHRRAGHGCVPLWRDEMMGGSIRRWRPVGGP